MAVSTVVQHTLLACLSILFFQSNAQHAADNDAYVPIRSDKGLVQKFDRRFSIHVTPTKYACGELPLTVSKQISNALAVEVGGGPAFRDRVVEKLFTGDALQKLPFVNERSCHRSGFGVHAGVRWLTNADPLLGFYVNPEAALASRAVDYPAFVNGETGLYKGHVTSVDIRLLLGYDRALSSYSEHLFYGGFLGFGMRRYAADYFAIDRNDAGSRRGTATIPTLHLGYRVGWKF